MEYSDFKLFVLEFLLIIQNDLTQLENVAQNVKEETSSATTTLRTTAYPGTNNIASAEAVFLSRCTVPMAMVCIAFIDVTGQWLNESDDKFAHSAQAFFKQIAQVDDLKNKDTATKFEKMFRHGIMHGFFPRRGFDVAYPTYEGNSLFADILSKGNTLDVRYLVTIIHRGISNIYIEIAASTDLGKKLFEGYRRWELKNND